MNSRDSLVLKKMLEYCQQLHETCRRLGDYEAFAQDFLYQNAACMCLLQIGELAGKISQETRDAMPQIPWRAIRGMRNLCAHDYGALDFKRVWNTIQEFVPELESEIRRFL